MGLSKHPPKSEARPLGTPRPRAAKQRTKKNAKSASRYGASETTIEKVSEENPSAPSETACAPLGSVVTSNQSAIKPQEVKEKIMTLKFTKISKKGTMAMFSGLRNVLRIPLAVFDGAPADFEVEGNFAGPKTVKAKLSKEERAALPKPTLAERVERRRLALARDEAKLAKQSQLTAAM